MLSKKITLVIEYLSEKRFTTVAGAWVYFFLSSVIPLAFLIVTAFGVFGVSLSEDLVSRLPEEFRSAGEVIISTAERASKSATLLFVVTVVFSCTTLLNQMSKDGDYLYGQTSKKKRGIFRRLWALGALAVLFVMFLGAAFIFAFGNFMIGGKTPKTFLGIIAMLLAFFIIIAFGYLILLLLNRFICPIKINFLDAGVGSLVSLFIMVLGTLLFTIYLKFFNGYNAFYGSLAAIVDQIPKAIRQVRCQRILLLVYHNVICFFIRNQRNHLLWP
jgi:membrane protein